MSFSNPSRRNQQGSALLIVFVFSAVLAVMLFMEMPVVIFEAQRDKEQLLIDRGNEYSQAVKLYIRKTGQYPPNLEALEKTNQIRFLRKKFKDPFTDKTDWRLLHAGPNGMLIDSKIKSAQNGPAAGSPLGTFATTSNNQPGNNQSSPFGGTTNGNSGFNSGGNTGVGSNGNSWFASNGNSTSPGFNSNASQPANYGNSNRFNNQVTAINGGMPNGAAVNGPENQMFRDGVAPNADGTDPNQVPSQLAAPQMVNPDGTPTQTIPRSPSFARAQFPNGTNGSVAGAVDPSQAPSSGFSQPVAAFPGNQTSGGPANPNAAVNGLFSNPNQPMAQTAAFGSATGSNSTFGGNGFGSSSQVAAGNSGATSGFGSSTFGNTQSGGLAGVASKAERHSIKQVNEQQDYSLWEFFYDPSKDPNRNGAGALAQAGGGTINQPGNPGLQQGNGVGQQNGGQQSPFGQSNTFGQSGGTGQSSPFGQSNGFGRSNSFGSQQGNSGSTNSGFGGFNSNSGGFGTNSNPQPQPPGPTQPPQ